jgi:hypothetical protein
VEDIKYGPHQRNQLDLYFPSSTSNPSNDPSIPDDVTICVFFHGGAWKKFGRRTWIGLHQNVGFALAKEGIVVAVPSYRLSEESLTIQRLPRYLLLSAAAAYLVLYGFSTFEILGPTAHIGLKGLYTRDGSLFILWSYQWILLSAVLFLSAFTWKQHHLNGVQHPMHVQDCSRAVCKTVSYCHQEWKRQRETSGSKRTFKPRLVLMGHSAGAHIAAMLALCPQFLEAATIEAEPYENKASSSSSSSSSSKNGSISSENLAQLALCGVICMSGEVVLV